MGLRMARTRIRAVRYFTRTRSHGTQIPYVVCSNIGHGIQRLGNKGQALRAPQIFQAASADLDQVVFENHDDQDYGYLRIILDPSQPRIEYHPVSDGPDAKTPDNFVTVDLNTRKLIDYVANDFWLPKGGRHDPQTSRGHRPEAKTAKSKITDPHSMVMVGD